MTVGQLRGMLEGLKEDAEVRVAFQPQYPLQSSIRGVCTSDDLAALDDEDAMSRRDDGDGGDLVWIVEGFQNHDEPYAPRDVFNIV